MEFSGTDDIDNDCLNLNTSVNEEAEDDVSGLCDPKSL